jgi:hypothetical protein
MDRNDLIRTAEKLKQVSEKSAAEFGSKREALVVLMNRKMESRPDLIDMVGLGNVEMMKDNHEPCPFPGIIPMHSPEYWSIRYFGLGLSLTQF